MVLYGLDGMTHRSQAYGLLAVGLREHWDLEQLPSIARGKRGKPLFPDFPQLRFNLSHSGPRALCALDRDEVGVDIQQITQRRSAFLDTCSPQRSGPGCWGWETTRRPLPSSGP